MSSQTLFSFFDVLQNEIKVLGCQFKAICFWTSKGKDSGVSKSTGGVIPYYWYHFNIDIDLMNTTIFIGPYFNY